MNITLPQIAQALSVSIAATGTVTGWSIDTRTIEPGNLFIALKGPNHDGHDHLKSAFAKGAIAALVATPFQAPTVRSGELIKVPDTLQALQALATRARQNWPGQVIGVTGSAGKTTTKEIIARLLSTTYKTGKTEGNFNNHIGLPLSILRLPEDAQFAVLELGMNHAGEIRDLAQIAKPRVAVVTNVGPAHIENFPAGLEGIAAAKRELVDALPRQDGVAILNADDPYVSQTSHPGKTITYGIVSNATVQARNLRLLDDHVEFSVENEEIYAPVAGRHNVLNILAGIAVGLEYGISLHTLAIAAAQLPVLKMRGERKVHNGVTIWDDCYNANPDAMRAMLDVLKQTPATRRIAVLGEMRELGAWSEKLHTEVGDYAASAHIDYVIAIHGDAKYTAAQHPAAQFVDDPETAGELLKQLARPGDAILFKGSRGTHVEKALERYLE